MSEAGPKQTKVSVRGDWKATVTNYESGEETQTYILDSTGVLESAFREHLLRRCDGRAAPNVIQAIRKFDEA